MVAAKEESISSEHRSVGDQGENTGFLQGIVFYGKFYALVGADK